jgi:hypothetical protein
MPHFPKGSPQARAFMAKLRAMRGRGSRRPVDRSHAKYLKQVRGKNPRNQLYNVVAYHPGDPPAAMASFIPSKEKAEEMAAIYQEIAMKEGRETRYVVQKFRPRNENPPMLVLGNPLTRHESADLINSARHDIGEARRLRKGRKRVQAAFFGGRATGKAIAVNLHSPADAYGQRSAAHSAMTKGYRFQNPSPRPKGIPPWMWNDPAFQAEVKAFRKRHGPNKRIEIVKVKVPKGFPKYFSVYGKAPAVMYDAPPGSPVGKRIHHFGKRGKKKPWLVSSASRGPRFLAYVGGSFKAKPSWIYD